MSRYFIGIDGGGTNTRSLRADENGRIVGTGKAGSTNRNHHLRDEVRANLRSALLAASGGKQIENSTTIFMGMCGVSNDADRADIISVVREIAEVGNACKIIVENDAVIGLAGGLSGRPGMVLIAGTGSACLGVNSSGESYWCGGWGALADDSGSAPWMGIRAIQAAVRAEDGRGEATKLRQIVFEFLGLKHPRELIDRVHNKGLRREEIGTLAPRIIAAAEQGDGTAKNIVRDAAQELGLMVSTTAGHLFGGEASEAILVGGLALSGPPFQPMLIKEIGSRAKTVRVREPEMSPVQGAVLEAMRAGNVTWTKSIFEQLRKGML